MDIPQHPYPLSHAGNMDFAAAPRHIPRSPAPSSNAREGPAPEPVVLRQLQTDEAASVRDVSDVNLLTKRQEPLRLRRPLRPRHQRYVQWDETAARLQHDVLNVGA